MKKKFGPVNQLMIRFNPRQFVNGTRMFHNPLLCMITAVSHIYNHIELNWNSLSNIDNNDPNSFHVLNNKNTVVVMIIY